jgi:hypothetical protein
MIYKSIVMTEDFLMYDGSESPFTVGKEYPILRQSFAQNGTEIQVTSDEGRPHWFCIGEGRQEDGWQMEDHFAIKMVRNDEEP